MCERWLIFLTLSVILSCGFGFAASADEHDKHHHLVVPSEEVAQRFEKNGIVPDVIDVAPKNVLHVEWETVEANLEHEHTPKEVKHQPAVHWEGAKAEAFYSLVMVDPDEFNRESHTEREVLHWLVVNIPGKHVEKGEVLAAYVGSGPPKDGGLHRYVLLKYEQPRKLVFDEPRLKFPSHTGFKDRVKFSSRKFAKKYNLGNPVAGNFYFARWDDSVPDLLKKLQ